MASEQRDMRLSNGNHINLGDRVVPTPGRHQYQSLEGSSSNIANRVRKALENLPRHIDQKSYNDQLIGNLLESDEVFNMEKYEAKACESAKFWFGYLRSTYTIEDTIGRRVVWSQMERKIKEGSPMREALVWIEEQVTKEQEGWVNSKLEKIPIGLLKGAAYDIRLMISMGIIPKIASNNYMLSKVGLNIEEMVKYKQGYITLHKVVEPFKEVQSVVEDLAQGLVAEGRLPPGAGYLSNINRLIQIYKQEERFFRVQNASLI